MVEFRLNYHLGPGPYNIETRYNPCQVLDDHQVRHVVWFEDALVHYGVPTVVFDLYILAEDIDLSANVLARTGWTFDMEEPHVIGNAKVNLADFPLQRLISPDGQTRTILLPAADWKFPLTPDTRVEYHAPFPNLPSLRVPFPSLSGLLDALIESWLECPSNESTLSITLACHVSYIYAHVPAVKQKLFAEQMRYEHRQFHFDVLAGMETGTLPFRRHQRAIRDALLQGQYELRDCSASRDRKELFSFLGGTKSQPVEIELQAEDALESAETNC